MGHLNQNQDNLPIEERVFFREGKGVSATSEYYRIATPQEVESGAVEKNVAEIIIEKNRSGERGVAKLLFKGEYSKFVNITNYDVEPPPEYNRQEPAKSSFEPVSEYEDVSTYSDNDIPPEDNGDDAF